MGRPCPSGPSAAVCATLISTLLASTQPAPAHAHGAGMAGRDACEVLAARPPAPLPRGWRVQCIDDPGGPSAGPRVIQIPRIMGWKVAVWAVTGQAALAESSTWPASTRAAVARQLGRSSWTGGPFSSQPAQVYAQNRTLCLDVNDWDGPMTTRRMGCKWTGAVAIQGIRAVDAPLRRRPASKWTQDAATARSWLWEWSHVQRRWVLIRYQ